MNLLDLRGMRCPWPAIRVGRALREGEGAVIAVADDPAAPGEIAAVAAAAGRGVTEVATPIGTGFRIAPASTNGEAPDG